MNCKNCGSPLADDASFCYVCGAKVVNKRANTLDFLKGFFIFFTNWDNSYIRTFRDLLGRPHVVMQAYIIGVRRRYVPPIVFLAVATALGMLVYNTLSDKYLDMSKSINDVQFDYFEKFNDEEKGIKIFDREQFNQDIEHFSRLYLKYYNIVTFLNLPFYAFISFLVFGWKKINFAEHLIINCYLQGFSLFLGTLFFIVGIYTFPSLSYYSIPITMFYYLFTYGKLLKLGVGKLILKLLFFILVLAVSFIIISIITGIIIFLLTILSGNMPN